MLPPGTLSATTLRYSLRGYLEPVMQPLATTSCCLQLRRHAASRHYAGNNPRVLLRGPLRVVHAATINGDTPPPSSEMAARIYLQQVISSPSSHYQLHHQPLPFELLTTGYLDPVTPSPNTSLTTTVRANIVKLYLNSLSPGYQCGGPGGSQVQQYGWRERGGSDSLSC